MGMSGTGVHHEDKICLGHRVESPGEGYAESGVALNLFILVSRAGLEPATLCLKGTCSTT